MAIVIGLMMGAFGAVGACLFVFFVRELARKIAALPYMERAEGTVTAIESKIATFHHDDSLVPTTMHFPVITFEVGGAPQTFKSEVGDGNKTRYFVGQRIGVRYDPSGTVPPTIDSWSGMWLTPIIGIAAGAIFMGGAALVYFAFGRRLLGW
jgi:hypothetical protein